MHITFDKDLGKDYLGRQIAGYASFSLKRCHIWIPMIEFVHDSYTWCIWGHELGHCILGTFHTKDEGSTC